MRLLSMLLAVVPLAGRVYAPGEPGKVDVKRIAVDTTGFVWVSGERGTFRFDGVDFLSAERLGLPTEGMTEVAVTTDGTVWALAANRVWRLDGSRFRQVNDRVTLPLMAAAGPLLYTNPGPLRVYYRDGAEWRWADGPLVDPQVRLHGGSDGRVWFGGGAESAKATRARWVRFRNGTFDQGEMVLTGERLPLAEVAVAGNDSVFAADATRVMRFERNGATTFAPVWEGKSTLPVRAKLLVGGGAELWHEACGMWLSSQGYGVRLPPVFGVAPDGLGRLWGALGEQGLYWAGGVQAIHSYSVEGLPDRPVVSVGRHGPRLYVARHDVAAVLEQSASHTRCDGTEGVEERMKEWGEFGLDSVLADIAVKRDGSIWVLGKNRGVMRLDATGKLIESVPNPDSRVFVPGMRKMAFSEDDRLWVASKENLVEVVTSPRLRYVQRFSEKRYFSEFIEADGKLFAVGDHSLLRYDAGRWHEQKAPDCLLSPKLRTAAILTTGNIWFGYRDRSGFTNATERDGRWSCRHFEASNGHPGDTQFLRWDSKGRLWRGSSAGVFVRRSDNRWDRIAVADGEMHHLFHENPDGSILVAMAGRLVRLPPGLADPDPGVAPVLSYVETSHSIDFHPVSLRWRIGSAPAIHVSALPERVLGGSPPLEYRFDANEWTRMTAHRIDLEKAPRSARRLEFRYSGSKQTTALPLAIEIPWWRTYWFGTLLLALLTWMIKKTVPTASRSWYHWHKRRFMARLQHEPFHRGHLVRNRYRIDGLIAEGGFSQIFAAIDQQTDARVVIKRLRLLDISQDHLRRRFAQEVAALSMVRHSGVVPILDAWIDETAGPLLVMPRVDGPTLRERLRNAPLQRAEALALLQQIADILTAAHERGIIHGDIKPENILLHDGRPLLIDFGTSALQLSAGLNAYSRPAGSVRYMAPEQLLGRYSKATDVYAFAVVAFEILTGRRYADLDLPMSENWEREFLRVSQSDLNLSPAEARALIEALRFDPQGRTQHVAELMVALADCS